jgi:hypothetical protein
LVEDARVGGFIHGVDVESRCVGEGGEWFFGLCRSGKGDGEEKQKAFHGCLRDEADVPSESLEARWRTGMA